MNRCYVERAQSEIDDAVRAKDDDEPDKTPEERLSRLCPLRVIARMEDELKPTPDKEDERRSGEQEDNRVDYLNHD